jgi:hypothetical protein
MSHQYYRLFFSLYSSLKFITLSQRFLFLQCKNFMFWNVKINGHLLTMRDQWWIRILLWISLFIRWYKLNELRVIQPITSWLQARFYFDVELSSAFMEIEERSCFYLQSDLELFLSYIILKNWTLLNAQILHA